MKIGTTSAKEKQYSYDHLEVYKYRDFLTQIKEHQNIAKIKSCFSDVVYRINSWCSKKKRLLVVTDRFLFFFSDGKKLKKVYKTKSILCLKHSEENNYICLQFEDSGDEIFETLRKEELILFFNRKMRRLGKELQIVSNREEGQSSLKEVSFNPASLKKYKPYL